jgi:carbamoyl-phosphate synthase large subunit
VAKLGPGEPGGATPDVVGVDAVDLIASGKVHLVVNTPRGRGPRADGAYIRLAASAHGVPCLTTIPAALAAAAGIAEWRTEEHRVRSLQEYHLDAQLRLPL